MILLGNRVIVKVHTEEEITATASGLLTPGFEIYGTDGAKLRSKPSENNLLAKGTVELISKQASTLLAQEDSPISVGDEIYFSSAVLSNIHSYRFQMDRTKKVVKEDEMYICIPTSLIEAKINHG